MPRRRRSIQYSHFGQAVPDRTRRRRSRKGRTQGRLSGLFLPPGLRAQVRAGFHLARSTPGLSVYLLGGLGIWLGWRVLTAHEVGGGFWGALLAGILRLLALSAVVAVYFRRTGQLAEARVHLRRLRAALALRPTGRETHSRPHRRMFRLLGWVLRVPIGRVWQDEG